MSSAADRPGLERAREIVLDRTTWENGQPAIVRACLDTGHGVTSIVGALEALRDKKAAGEKSGPTVRHDRPDNEPAAP